MWAGRVSEEGVRRAFDEDNARTCNRKKSKRTARGWGVGCLGETALRGVQFLSVCLPNYMRAYMCIYMYVRVCVYLLVVCIYCAK